MRCRLSTIVCAVSAGLAGAASAQGEYRWDDGLGDRAMGSQMAGDIAWMNWFPVQPGLEKITAVRIAFSGMPEGVPFTAHVWRDANGFEDPFSATLLSSGSGVTAAGTNSWVVVDVPDVEVSKGFFAGVIFENDPPLYSPCLFDRSPPLNRHSWFLFGGWILPDDLFGGGGYPWKLETIINGGGDWLIRADARSLCDADFNGDGGVNTLDVLDFLNAWSTHEPSGDFNEDGQFNTLEVLEFLNAWNAGCQ